MKKIMVLLISIILIVIPFILKKPKQKITELTRLDFYYSTSTTINGWVSYEIECNDKCILTIKPNNTDIKQEVELNKKTMNKIKEILNKYEVIKWDGFSKSDKNVLDGNSFHMYLTIQNNQNISASGYMMYPDNYRNVESELDELLGGFYKDETSK